MDYALTSLTLYEIICMDMMSMWGLYRPPSLIIIRGIDITIYVSSLCFIESGLTSFCFASTGESCAAFLKKYSRTKNPNCIISF